MSQMILQEDRKEQFNVPIRLQLKEKKKCKLWLKSINN